MRVIVFTSSYSKRPYFLRQSMLGVVNQTYKNLVHAVNITMDSDSTTNDHTPLYDDLDRSKIFVTYNKNQHSHLNNMAAIKAVPDYMDYDVFIKMDDDDIHKAKYVETIVEFFKTHSNIDAVSTKINYQLNGFDIFKGLYDNLGANPPGTTYHMPMTFAFTKKALKEIIDLTEVYGYDDHMWRNAWTKAGLKHHAVDNANNILWHLHGKNQSCPEFLRKPNAYSSITVK